jgi:hypothetical protein
VIFDVGGNHIGATPLGSFYQRFRTVPPETLHVLYVLNPYRPFCETPEEVLNMMDKIMLHSRLRITGLINNANMGADSEAAHLCSGYQIIRKVSEASGIPVAATCGQEGILRAFEEMAQNSALDARYIGRLLPITIYTHRDWERFTQLGM